MSRVDYTSRTEARLYIDKKLYPPFPLNATLLVRTDCKTRYEQEDS